jgi:lipoyl(octanoyl) transferase
MRSWTAARGPQSEDELWVVEHPPVYTLGLNGAREHLLAPGGIPVVQTDRGGQVTYHGPGQVVLYVLIDLKRAGLTIRSLVHALEQSVIDFLAAHGLYGERRGGAPGVYVEDAKVAALGLRILRGCSYHGLALNVDMDLEPYARINPCGQPGLRVTDLKSLGLQEDAACVAGRLLDQLTAAIYPEVGVSASHPAPLLRAAAP